MSQRKFAIGAYFLAALFLLMGVAVMLAGQAILPIRWNSSPATGWAAYSMGLSWIFVAASAFFAARTFNPNLHHERNRLGRDFCFVLGAVLFVFAVIGQIVGVFGLSAP